MYLSLPQIIVYTIMDVAATTIKLITTIVATPWYDASACEVLPSGAIVAAPPDPVGAGVGFPAALAQYEH
jgi:hypothetical protein